MSKLREKRMAREDADLRFAARQLRKISLKLADDWPEAAADIEWVVVHYIIGRGLE